MSDLYIRTSWPTEARWSYDDPSGLPEGPLTFTLPEPLRAPVEAAASRAGVTPARWLADLVSQTLRPTAPRAA
jgi:hypothetical protein